MIRDPMIQAFMELHHFQKVFDEAAKDLEQDIGKSLCVTGCGKCCEVNTPMAMTIEAMNAVSVLTGLGRLQKILSLTEGWLLERNPKLTVYEGIPFGMASPKLREEHQFVSSSQCPYLAENKRCLIYEVRPLICRAWGVVREPADYCPRPPGKGETLTQKRYINDSQGLLRHAIQEFKDKCKKENLTWIIHGSIPTLIYRSAKPDKFRSMGESKQIPSARMIGTNIDTSLMWQPQVEALRSGVSPDLVAIMR